MRRLLVLITIFFLTAPLVSVSAQETETFTVNGKTYTVDFTADDELGACDGGVAEDGQVCHTNGDIVNPTFSPGTTTKPCHEEVVDEETGETDVVCVNSQTHVRDDTFTWGPKPGEDYSLIGLKNMLEGARRPLTPQSVWDKTTRNTNPQWPSWIARGCDYKQQTGQPTELVRNEVSLERMKLGPDLNIPPVVENLEYYKSIFSTLKKDGQNYQKAIDLVKKLTAYDCGYKKTAVDVLGSIKESQGMGIWELLKIIFQTMLFTLEEQFHSWKEITETARMPYSEEMAGGLIQATEETLVDSRISQIRRQTIMENPGIVETFRPCSVQFEGPEKNGQVLNEYEWVNGGGTFDIDSRFHLMKLVDESTNFTQSAILPASRQSSKHKISLKTRPCGGQNAPLAGIRNAKDAIEKREEPQCSTKKPISPSVSHGGLEEAIAAAAAWAKIPSCVLAGVSEIEGADQEMAQSTCIPNQCGAAGPFQISVGVDSCGQTDCKSCGPSWADGNRTCNNESWALQEAGGTAADACNVEVAAKAAAAVVKGKANGFGVPFAEDASVFDPNDMKLKQTIITATDAYYGVTSPIPRLGNLSYGEYVYQTCVGAPVTHCDHTFPYNCP